MAHYRQCGLVKGPKLRVCKEGLLLILSVYLWDCIYNLIWKWLQRSKLEGHYECEAEWPCWHPWRGSTENSSAGGAGFARYQSPLPFPLTPTLLQKLLSWKRSSTGSGLTLDRYRDPNGPSMPQQGSQEWPFVLPRRTSALIMVLWISLKECYAPFLASLEDKSQKATVLFQEKHVDVGSQPGVTVECRKRVTERED